MLIMAGPLSSSSSNNNNGLMGTNVYTSLLFVMTVAMVLASSNGLSPKYGFYTKRSSNKVVAGRRKFVQISLSSSIILLPQLLFVQESHGSPSQPLRDIDVGGGFDLLSVLPLSEKDVIYPKSMEGSWICERVITRVEGDAFQAESAYRSLGSKTKLEVGGREKFETKFIRSPTYGDSGGVVLDRGYEIASRTGISDVQWTAENPDFLHFGKTELLVVKRSVEVPNERGFGFDELLRVDDLLLTRAVQVKRRYRRSFDERGNRVVEGLEIVKTFRVLDGIAGTEFPTSTIKSQIRMVRP
jgi:hypothetical protein